MKRFGLVLLLALGFLSACKENKLTSENDDFVIVKGHWVTEQDGQIMLDPQTSGLSNWRGQLLTLSDRSAHLSQRLRLRKIQINTGRLQSGDLLMELSERVAASCFAAYLSGNPDLESLAVDPDNDKVIYVTTEDASYATLSEECQQKFGDTGSTRYPSLLVRLELHEDNRLLMTHVRPIQFAASMEIGDMPNDGLEGLTFGPNQTLYLGLETDSHGRARIFTVNIDEGFWLGDGFIQIKDLDLKLPKFEGGRHPINGMTYYQHKGMPFLIAAARNDETLWIIDLAAQKETRILPLKFDAAIIPGDTECGEWERMNNSSIEGVTVVGSTLWMINDPWKEVYSKNIKCELNREKFENMAPLIFSLPLKDEWFE